MISGMVRDAQTGESLPNASVYYKEDPTTGTATDSYGHFELDYQPMGILVFSYTGYQQQERTIYFPGERMVIQLTPGVTLPEVEITARQYKWYEYIPGLIVLALIGWLLWRYL